MSKIRDDKSSRVQDVRNSRELPVPSYGKDWSANEAKNPNMFPASMDIKRKNYRRTYGGPGKPPSSVPGPRSLMSAAKKRIKEGSGPGLEQEIKQGLYNQERAKNKVGYYQQDKRNYNASRNPKNKGKTDKELGA